MLARAASHNRHSVLTLGPAGRHLAAPALTVTCSRVLQAKKRDELKSRHILKTTALFRPKDLNPTKRKGPAGAKAGVAAGEGHSTDFSEASIAAEAAEDAAAVGHPPETGGGE